MKYMLMSLYVILFSHNLFAQNHVKPKFIFYCKEGCLGCSITKDSLFKDGDVLTKLKKYDLREVKPSIIRALLLSIFKGIDRIPSFELNYRNINGERIKRKYLGFMSKEKLLAFLDLSSDTIN